MTEQGWQVTATVRDPQNAENLKAVEGVRIEAVDLDEPASLEVLVQKLRGEVFDVLFVNAGITGAQHQRGAKLTAG
ncbi:hypothetical protein WAI91_23500, partial [Acinetobacter baumannii]